VERELDLTGLEPPKPLQRVLDVLADLPAGDRLHVLLRHEPFPLYALLHRMGYEWTGSGGDDGFEILIWNPDLGQEGDSPTC
jgi:uncharacterized protein (DUF2249 family)